MRITVAEHLFRSSNTTSEVIDCRDAFDLAISAYTSAGTTSVLTYQVSNYTGRIGLLAEATIPEGSWSNWTVFTPSESTIMSPILGARYARILKGPTGTFVISYNKTTDW